MHPLSHPLGPRAHDRSGPRRPHVALGQGLSTLATQRPAAAPREDSLQQAARLLADTAHDLHGSLTAARELVRLVSSGVDGPVTAAQRESLSSVIERCDEMDRLVTNMLDGERLQTQSPRTVRAPIDVQRLGTALLANLRPTAQQRCVRLDYRPLPAGHRPPFGDPDQVQRLLSNLAHNAIRASTAGSEVRIAGTPAAGGRKVRFTVADVSGSFPLDRVGDLARRGTSGGDHYGLGLSIATQLAALQFGFIDITAVPDRSTQASVELPVSSPEPVINTFLNWRGAWLHGRPQPAPPAHVLPPRIPRPRHPAQLLVMSLRADCPSRFAAGVDSIVQSDSRYHELVYRCGELEWIVLWDEGVESATRRLEKIRTKAAVLVPVPHGANPSVLVCQRRMMHRIDAPARCCELAELFLQLCTPRRSGAPEAAASSPLPPPNPRLETRLEEEVRRLTARLRRGGRALRDAAQDARR